jgi:hypothetical protein
LKQITAALFLFYPDIYPHKTKKDCDKTGLYSTLQLPLASENFMLNGIHLKIKLLLKVSGPSQSMAKTQSMHKNNGRYI